MVVAVSSTANARRSAPARPALTAGEVRRGPEAGTRLGGDSISAGHQLGKARTPRPWAAALQRPAAKILVAGGLTLAGWLLTGALSGSTASAAETASCPEAPAVSTVDHSAKPFAHGRHHRSHREDAKCARQADETQAGPATTGEPETTAADTEATAKQSTKDTQPAEEPSTAPAAKATSSGGLLGGLVGGVTSATKPLTEPATTTKSTSSGCLLTGLVGTVTSATEPLTQPTTKATSSGDLLGGLVGGVLNVVGGTLNTVTTTVSGTLNTVTTLTDTLSHTVLAPLTQAPANNPDAPVLLPLDDLLDPILGGSSNSGGVTVTVPGVVSDTLTPVTTAAAAGTGTAPAAAEAATTSTASRVAVVHLVEVQHTLRVQQQEQPRDSGVHARNGGGGDSTPGLPGGTTAPSAPAPTAAPGHDGPGGVRHPFAVHTDDVTTTQLKLIGASLDHDVDGAGREAALPTTSPD